MKRRLTGCLSLLLCLSMLAAGCASGSSTPAASPTPNPTAQLTSAQLLQAALEKIEFSESFEMTMFCLVEADQVKGKQSTPVKLEEYVLDVMRTLPAFSTEREYLTTLQLGDNQISTGRRRQEIYDYKGMFMQLNTDGDDTQPMMIKTANWFKPTYQATIAKKGTVAALAWSTVFSDVRQQFIREVRGVECETFSAKLQVAQVVQLLKSDPNRRYQQNLILSACNYLLADGVDTLETVDVTLYIAKGTDTLMRFELDLALAGLNGQTAKWMLNQAGKQTKVTLAQLQNLKVYASVDFDKIDAVPAKDDAE